MLMYIKKKKGVVWCNGYAGMVCDMEGRIGMGGEENRIETERGGLKELGKEEMREHEKKENACVW